MLSPETKQSGGKLVLHSDLRARTVSGEGIRQENSFTKFTIGTWNVRTLQQGGKLENLKIEIDKNNVCIVGVSEVRWRDQGDFESGNYHVLLGRTSGYSDNATSDHDDEEVEIIYEKTEGRGKVQTIKMGDWNSVVGKGAENNIVSHHGLGIRNRRGDMMVDFCRRNGSRSITGDRSRYQIDYILVKQRFRNSVKDVTTVPSADIDSVSCKRQPQNEENQE
ncbi:craniofacial development protein 2-like [Zootermopsis nevadensis]|uniref:craniofacial development protein 2-like n=1 Tax=Zootermopsis nevadensis TaxID=136037 RepID=UPI000B8E614F|nr:craniofacial development protein 2-like [Zootermopsis nevadensis]